MCFWSFSRPLERSQTLKDSKDSGYCEYFVIMRPIYTYYLIPFSINYLTPSYSCRCSGLKWLVLKTSSAKLHFVQFEDLFDVFRASHFNLSLLYGPYKMLRKSFSQSYWSLSRYVFRGVLSVKSVALRKNKLAIQQACFEDCGAFDTQNSFHSTQGELCTGRIENKNPLNKGALRTLVFA